MTKEEIRDEIYDYLSENLTLEMANDYMENVGREHIYEMCDFEDEMSNYSYADVINMAQNGNFYDGDNYFEYDSCAINTFDSLDDEVGIGDMASYCVDNDEDFGDDHIRELLDKLGNELTLRVHTIVLGDELLTLEEFLDEYRGKDKLFTMEGNRYPMDYTEVESACSDKEGEVDLYEYTATNRLKKIGFNKFITVIEHDGIVFGNKDCYNDGRFFQWFYKQDTNLLLKLYMEGPTSSEVLYVQEMPKPMPSELFNLIETYNVNAEG